MCCMSIIFCIGNIINDYQINVSLCASIIALLMAMIGVSLPLIINSTSKVLSEYQNDYITQMFKEEKDYIFLRSVIPWIIFYALFAFFFIDYINKIKALAFVVALIMFSFAIMSIFIYIRYLKTFTEYAIHSDKKVLKFVNKKLEKFIKNNESDIDPRQIVDLYAKLLQKKAKYDCDDSFYKSFDILTKYIILLSASVREQEGKNKKSDLWIKFSLIAAHFYRSYFELVKILMKRDIEGLVILHDKFRSLLKKIYFMNPLIGGDIPFDNIFRAYAYQVSNADILNDKKGFLGKFAWEWWFDITKGEYINETIYMPLSYNLFPILRVLAVRHVSTSIIAFIAECVDTIDDFNKYKSQHEKELDFFKDRSKYFGDDIITLNGLMFSTLYADTVKDTMPEMGMFVRKLFLRNQACIEIFRIGAYCKFKKVDEVPNYIISLAEKLKTLEISNDRIMEVLKERNIHHDQINERNYNEYEEVSNFLKYLDHSE